MSGTSGKTPARRPKTAEELLELEEEFALQQIERTARVLGDDLCAAYDLRAEVRRHPLLSTGLVALAGFAVGPFAPRAGKLIPLGGAVAGLASSMRSHPLSGLVLTSWNRARARRGR